MNSERDPAREAHQTPGDPESALGGPGSELPVMPGFREIALRRAADAIHVFGFQMDVVEMHHSEAARCYESMRGRRWYAGSRGIARRGCDWPRGRLLD